MIASSEYGIGIYVSHLFQITENTALVEATGEICGMAIWYLSEDRRGELEIANNLTMANPENSLFY